MSAVYNYADILDEVLRDLKPVNVFPFAHPKNQLVQPMPSLVPALLERVLTFAALDTIPQPRWERAFQSGFAASVSLFSTNHDQAFESDLIMEDIRKSVGSIKALEIQVMGIDVNLCLENVGCIPTTLDLSPHTSKWDHSVSPTILVTPILNDAFQAATCAEEKLHVILFSFLFVCHTLQDLIWRLLYPGSDVESAPLRLRAIGLTRAPKGMGEIGETAELALANGLSSVNTCATSVMQIGYRINFVSRTFQSGSSIPTDERVADVVQTLLTDTKTCIPFPLFRVGDLDRLYSPSFFNHFQHAQPPLRLSHIWLDAAVSPRPPKPPLPLPISKEDEWESELAWRPVAEWKGEGDGEYETKAHRRFAEQVGFYWAGVREE